MVTECGQPEKALALSSGSDTGIGTMYLLSLCIRKNCACFSPDNPLIMPFSLMWIAVWTHFYYIQILKSSIIYEFSNIYVVAV